MKWLGRRESSNVDDRRSSNGGKFFVGGTIGVIILVVKFFMDGDPTQLIQQIDQQNTQTTEVVNDSLDNSMAKFVAVVLADNEDVWNKIFTENGLQYQEPKLVLFRGATESGCGNASSAIGPFYCPADKKVYIDLSFMDELKTRFGAQGGDFALAYVIGHEVGHHVQNLLGTSAKTEELQTQSNQTKANKLSVALELQADFYAGVWTYHNQQMKNILEQGDVEEALSAASAVGDDAIQQKTQGTIVPDAFTHGSSAERMYWFKRGYQTGDIRKGNTFAKLIQ